MTSRLHALWRGYFDIRERNRIAGRCRRLR
jgi:hypothetical protein